MNLRDWRKSKNLTQGELGEKLGIGQNTYSAYETGRLAFPHALRVKLEKMGYKGPWPHEESAAPEKDRVTREEFLELRGQVKSFVQYWRDGEEKVLKELQELGQRIAQLEKRVS